MLNKSNFMRLVKGEKISKEITGKYSCDFIFPENGFYLIEIIGSAKSWWQNFKSGRSFFKDDTDEMLLARLFSAKLMASRERQRFGLLGQ